MKIKNIFLFLLCSIFLVACNSNVDKTSTSIADAYLELLNSNEKSAHKNFSLIQKALQDIRTESGAKYVYLIMPMENEKASLTGDPKGDFMLTIDGSEEPEDWGIIYHSEVQFTEAWNKTPAAARSAWADGADAHCWSAFAPIYDSNKNVVALLGIDYPATDVISIYPQWNRNDTNWNGYTDKIAEDIPAEIQEKMNQVISLATKYAEELSK